MATDAQRRNLDTYLAVARRTGERNTQQVRGLGYEEDRVIGEYTPGSEIPDVDGTFAMKFLYAFWRLCEQRIAVTETTGTGHAARVNADKAGVSADVRVTQLRPAATTGDDDAPGEDASGRWRHRWVVRMHKVRQWYPTEQRHKVLYRGPYLKGPEDKPLLGGDVVRGLTR